MDDTYICIYIYAIVCMYEYVIYIYTQIHIRYTHTIHFNIGILNQTYLQTTPGEKRWIRHSNQN